MTTTSAISRAVQLMGSQSALARKLKCTPQAVQKWEKTGKVPAERVIPIEEAVERQVTRTELRPDLYPDEHPVTA